MVNHGKTLLTPAQRRCVEWPGDRPLVIRGSTGSGKTTILVERAIFLEKSYPRTSAGPKVLLIAHHRAIVREIQRRLVEKDGELVEVATFYSWAIKLLRTLGLTQEIRVVDTRERYELIRFARITVTQYHPLLNAPRFPRSLESHKDSLSALREQDDFLSAEIGWIKALGKDFSRYIKEPRSGRGTAVSVLTEHREWIWKVFETYQLSLKRAGRIDWDDVALILNERANSIPMEYRPSYVLVDDALDLTPMQIKVLERLAMCSVTLAVDPAQSVYSHSFSLSNLGVDSRISTHHLRETFRLTGQVASLANSLICHDPFVGNITPLISTTKLDGAVPRLYLAASQDVQVHQVADWATTIRATFPDDSIGLIVPNSISVELYTRELTRRSIPSLNFAGDTLVEGETSAVRVCTVQASKGLEFDHVAVVFPRNESGTLSVANPDEYEEHLAIERRKLYVAMTRARVSLTLFVANPPSQLVAELDPSLFVRMS